MLGDCVWAGFWGWEGWTAIEALAVIGALVFAFFALRSEITATTTLVRDYVDKAEDRRRRFADTVIVYPAGFQYGADGHPEFTACNMRIEGGPPVTAVRAWVTSRTPFVLPLHTGYEESWPHEPGEVAKFQIYDEDAGYYVRNGQAHRFVVEFVDANGVMWRKDGTGFLEEVEPDDYPPPIAAGAPDWVPPPPKD